MKMLHCYKEELIILLQDQDLLDTAGYTIDEGGFADGSQRSVMTIRCRNTDNYSLKTVE